MSTNPVKTSKATTLAQVQALIAGTQKYFSNAPVTFGNATHTAAELVQDLQSLANSIAALNAAETGVKEAVLANRATAANVGPLIGNYKRFLHATFSNAPAKLADFGLQPPKARTPMTSDKRAAATAKSKATRQARGTTSKKQKLAVKGDVTSVTITPVTATPVASPTAAPAVPASNANAPSVAPK